MAVTRNMDARLEALEKAMEEQANHLTAIEAKLNERAAIQKSQFDLIRQQLAALGYLIGHMELTSIPAAVETTTIVPGPPPVNILPAIATTALILPSPPSPSLIVTREAQLVPDSPAVPPPHLPFLLQQPPPMLSLQQPTISHPVSSASQLLLHSMVSDSVCVYLVKPLPHTMILFKGLWLWFLHLAGADLLVQPLCWLDTIYQKQIDVQHWKIWAVF